MATAAIVARARVETAVTVVDAPAVEIAETVATAVAALKGRPKSISTNL